MVFKRRSDFNVTVVGDDAGEQVPIAAYAIADVRSVINKMQNATNSPMPKVRHSSLSLVHGRSCWSHSSRTISSLSCACVGDHDVCVGPGWSV